MKRKPIYPFLPFQNLNNKNVLDNFESDITITIDELKAIVSLNPDPAPKIRGLTVEDRILSIFQDENYRFGPKQYIIDHSDYWLSMIRHFTSQEIPLQMVVMACPFKVPVPLKTNRITADLGEVLQIVRLRNIAQWIGSIYKPGAIITILAEGILGEAHGISEADRRLYKESLPQLLVVADNKSRVKIHDLDNIFNVIPNFRDLWQEQIAALKTLFKNKDPIFLREFADTYRSIYHMVPTREYSDEILMDVYNDDLSTNMLSSTVHEIRMQINQAAKEAVFSYHGFLKARDKSNYLEKIIPNYIKLTVSPKPSNLGIIPINIDTHILPHHGVPVHLVEDRKFTIQYLIDIRRSPLRYRPVHLESDPEKKPYYYEQIGI